MLVHQAGWGRFMLRIVLACAVMAMLLHEFVPPETAWLEANVWQTIFWLGAAVGGGAVVYVGVLLATGMRPAELRMKPPAM